MQVVQSSSWSGSPGSWGYKPAGIGGTWRFPRFNLSSVRSALAFAVAWRPDLVRDQGLTQGLSPAHSATWDGLRRLEG